MNIEAKTEGTSEGVLCPCCDTRFPRFLPHGRGEKRRLGAECPRCQSLERHRILALYLKHSTNLFRERLSLLDIAPASCLTPMLSALDNVRYVSAALQSPLAMVKTDICKMPFPSESFDAVFCMHVLQYVPDDRQGIAELFRVMKPGAWAIAQVPIHWDRAETLEDASVTRPSAKTVRWPAEAAVRHYGRDFTDRLVSGGVTVDVVSCLKHLSADTIAAHGLKASDDRKVWVCTKPR